MAVVMHLPIGTRVIVTVPDEQMTGRLGTIQFYDPDGTHGHSGYTYEVLIDGYPTPDDDGLYWYNRDELKELV